MTNEIADKIETIITQNNNLTESQVCHLMVLMRKLIDKEKINDLEVLEFFCDWSVHSMMDRVASLIIIQRINTAITTLQNSGPDLATTLISSIISFSEFKKEIKELLSKFNIPTATFDVIDFWKNFAEKLIMILRDCPLQIPEQTTHTKAKKLIEQIRTNPIKPGCWVTQVSIVAGPIPILGDCVNLHIIHSNTTHLVVPFLIE